MSDLSISSQWDRAVTDAELDQFYGKEIPAVAWKIGTDAVLQDQELWSEWIANLESDRQDAFCGPISTLDLFTYFIWNDSANAEQVDGARKEIKKRFLADHEEQVKRRAEQAMEA